MTLVRTPAPIWNIPMQRNPFFTERDNEVVSLHEDLQRYDAVALSQPQAITGLGGMGKTQIAVEYAYRYKAHYAAILWVQASSVESLFSSFIELAQVLNLPVHGESDARIIVEAVLHWLRSHHDWLCIFDNMDEPVISEPFLPAMGSGHILITTRAQALSNLAQCVEVQPMNPEVGAVLLLHRAQLLPLQSTLEQANEDDRTFAREISKELGGLPLALDQAGAYINATSCSLRDYFLFYQNRRQEVLRKRGNQDQKYPDSVATTWSLSFEKVCQQHLAAEAFLNICAFLAPEVIPEALIVGGASHLGHQLAPVASDPLQWDSLCRDMLRYSLIQRENGESLRMHRLVQAVVQDRVEEEDARQWKKRAMQAVNTTFPDVQSVDEWIVCERWLPHALLSAQWIKEDAVKTVTAAQLLNQTGYYLNERGRYDEAEPLFEQSLAIFEQELSALHPTIADSLNNLADVYRSQGRYKEAELLLKRGLAICKRTSGVSHFDTARSLNNLGALYKEQEKFADAEPLLKRAAKLFEQELGVSHHLTTKSMNNLAELYRTQGKYAEAKPLYEQTIAIKEQVLGLSHPSTAISVSNLAILYYAQKRYKDAEPLYKRAMTILEQVLGESHPLTATCANNLAALYKEQGKYSEADHLYKHALAIREQELGTSHPLTALCMGNLAELYRVQGRYAEAEPLMKRALKVFEQELGVVHSLTAGTLNNLALIYQAQGQYAEAETIFRQALAIDERVYGKKHLEVATDLDNLGHLYRTLGQHRKAEAIFKRVLALKEQLWGKSHLETVKSLNDLACAYQEQGLYRQAEPLYERAIEICEQILGVGHEGTQTIRDNYKCLLNQWNAKKHVGK